MKGVGDHLLSDFALTGVRLGARLPERLIFKEMEAYLVVVEKIAGLSETSNRPWPDWLALPCGLISSRIDVAGCGSRVGLMCQMGSLHTIVDMRAYPSHYKSFQSPVMSAFLSGYRVTAAMPPFTHRALPSGPAVSTSIRLIQLLPKNSQIEPSDDVDAPDDGRQARVHCTLFDASLIDPPPYAGLSYTWGDPNEKDIITVNGLPFPVTVNLERALFQLRQDDEPLTLWVDAICIDQSNETEKTEQVQEMRQIYMHATSVITWLGPAADNSDVAMEWIQNFGSLAHSFRIGSKPELMLLRLLDALETTPEKLPDNNQLKTFLKQVISQLTSESHDVDITRTALRDLFRRPYWSRVWIIQEVAHAKSIKFVCGDKSITEDAFHHSLRLVRNFRQFRNIRKGYQVKAQGSGSAVFPTNTQNPINLLKIRRAPGPLPLIYLVRMLKFFKAGDPRDRVFALLGLAADGDTLGLRPDYHTKSYQDVYHDAAAALITHGYLDVLSLCDKDNALPGYPSWVPDFTKTSGRLPLQIRALDRGADQATTILKPAFQASGIRNDSVPLPTNSPAGLCLQAKLVDVVKQVGTPYEQDGQQKWLQELSELCQSDEAGNPDQLRVVLRTAVADQEVWRGVNKPRLTTAHLDKVYSIFEHIDLSNTDAKTLLALGPEDYYDQLKDAAQRRRPFSTSAGRIGIGPCQLAIGDRIYIFAGNTVPCLVRQGEDEKLRLVGEVFVHGIMDGEAIKDGWTGEEIVLA